MRKIYNKQKEVETYTKVATKLYDPIFAIDTERNPYNEDIQFEETFYVDPSKTRNNHFTVMTCYRFVNNLPKVFYTFTFIMSKKEFENRMNKIF